MDTSTGDNSKEIRMNGIQPDAYVESETIECDRNENEKTGFEDSDLNELLTACSGEFDTIVDSSVHSPTEHGDKVFELAVDSLKYTDACNDSLKSEKHESELDNPSLSSSRDFQCTENTSKLDKDPNEGVDALNYFDAVEFGDTNQKSVVEAKNEEKSPIPNGMTKTDLISDLKKEDSKKQILLNKKKSKKILQALKENDTQTLAEAALSEGGLLNDEIRRKVWPKLAGVDVYETSPRPCQKEIEAHPYYNQVVLDVNRSLKRFPPSIHEAQRLMMLDQLVFLIMRVLCKHPEMHYYQGYHDICVTFLLVLGEETAYYVVEKLSRTHLKVFMEKNMEPTIHLLEHMYVLIGKRNPKLKDFLLKSEVGVAYCLSWLITWFGHVLNDYNYVVRLFDFFIVSHPYMPMYLTTAVVLHQETEVLKQDCDMASVHSFLSNISDDLPFEELILDSLELFEDYTPKMLAKEHPYVPRSLTRPNKKFNLIQAITKTIKSVVPRSNMAIPIVVAAAVVVTAVLYQAYKY